MWRFLLYGAALAANSFRKQTPVDAAAAPSVSAAPAAAAPGAVGLSAAPAAAPAAAPPGPILPGGLAAAAFDPEAMKEALGEDNAEKGAPSLMPGWSYAHQDQWPQTCHEGTQSPATLLNAVPPVLAKEKLLFQYVPIELNVELFHDGSTVSVTLPEPHGGFGLGESFETLQPQENEVFSFWQMALHHPGEHLFEGKEVPVELQLYHTKVFDDNCRQAVLSVGFDVNPLFPMTPSPAGMFLNKLAELIPKSKGVKESGGVVLDPNLLFKSQMVNGTLADASWARYGGTVSQPPCSGADVFVRLTAAQVPQSTLDLITEALIPASRQRTGEPVVPTIYGSINCVGLTASPAPEAAKINVLTGKESIKCEVPDDVVDVFPKTFPPAVADTLSTSAPADLLQYCTGVIEHEARNKTAADAYVSAVGELDVICEEAHALLKEVRNTAGPKGQESFAKANSKDKECKEKTVVVDALKATADTENEELKKAVDSAMIVLTEAIKLAGAPHQPSVKAKRKFKCNDKWPFGNPPTVKDMTHLEAGLPRAIGNPVIGTEMH